MTNPPRPLRLSSRVPVAALCGSILAFSTLASGSSVLETVGAPGVGNGFTARVMARSAEATYFNPSLLPDIERTLDFGTSALLNGTTISLAPRTSGLDVPTSIYDADLVRSPQPGPMWPQPTSSLLNRRSDTRTRELTPYVALGLVRPLLEEHLVYGLYVVVPTTGFLQQDAFFVDEREQYFTNQLHFELLGDRLRVPTIATALGGRVTRGLSWGAGMDVGMRTSTLMHVYIPDAADQRTLLIDSHIETHIAVAPFFGVTFRPTASWSLSATFHSGQSWDTSGENRVRFWDYRYEAGQSAVVQHYELTQGGEPWRASLGATTQGKLGASHWRLGLQGLYTDWSSYRDRHGERPRDAFHDTVNLGLGWAIGSSRRTFVGELGIAPTPVPPQTGRSNYVDSTRLGASLGCEWPFRWGSMAYLLGFHVQGQALLPRTVEKRLDVASPVIDEAPDHAVDRVQSLPLPGTAGLQTNNPGYPGYRSSGVLIGAALVVRVLG